MVPMIDLLMVTIAFLLVTAVWSQLSRLEGSTDAPAPAAIAPPPPPSKSLHVDLRAPGKFVLSWRQGHAVLRSVVVDGDAHALAKAVGEEWRSNGAHTSPSDPERDAAVLHTANDMRFADMVAVMDAIEGTRRTSLRGDGPAFALTLSAE
jgi:biopolymer transport protein ExbD